MEILEHVLHHAWEDSIKILPFLFITYLIMEYLEEKMTGKTKQILMKTEKSGPAWGAVLGMLPQCGFSTVASNLYAGKVITVGTLIAVYLSTSDEMLPIMISEQVAPGFIVKVLLLKAVIGMAFGFLIDMACRCMLGKKEQEPDIHHFCEHEHCKCGHSKMSIDILPAEWPSSRRVAICEAYSILKPAIRHTVQIWVYIFLITIVLNLLIEGIGEQALADFILNKPIIAELLAGIVGLIPNCASSVVITQLYLDGIIRFGTMMSGLLVGAGVGILVLLRVNDDKKDNLKIIGVLYVIGVVCGMLINLFC